MRNTLLLTGLLLLATSSTFASNSMSIAIELNGTDTYKIDGKNLKGDRSSATGGVTIDLLADGEEINMAQKVPATDIENTMNLEVVSKNEVHITDDKFGVDAIVLASIEKNMFGKIKKITISSEQLEIALAPLLKQQGLDMAKGFKMDVDNGSFSMDYQVSALSCSRDEKLMICNSSFKFNMDAKF